MGQVLQAILAVKTILEMAVSIGAAVSEYLKNRAIKQAKDKLQAAYTRLMKAKQIQDPVQRIKETASAQCEIEKVSNPDADCSTDIQ